MLPRVISRDFPRTVAVTLAAVALLTVLTAAGGYVYGVGAVASDGSLDTAASVRAESVGDWRAGLAAQTRLLSAAGPIADGNATSAQRYLTGVSTRATDSVAGVYYVRTDDGGGTVAASTDEPVRGSSLATARSAWQRAVGAASDGPAQSVVTTRSGYDHAGNETLVFASPVPDGGGVVVLVGQFDPTRLGGPGTTTAVVGSSGDPVFDPARGGVGRLVGANRLDADGPGTVRTDGGRRVAYAPVDGTDWTVVTATDRGGVARPAGVFGLTLGLVVAVTLCSLTVAGVAVHRAAVRPAAHLRDRVTDLGSGAFETDLSTDRTDEFGRLAAALAETRDALRAQVEGAHEAREVAERSKAELERQNRRLDQFASTLSHDIRNPLAVARGHTELLAARLDGLDDDADLRDHVQKLARAHDRIEAIIDDVLTLTREAEAARETERVSVESVAREAWDHVDSGDATLAVTGDRTVEADRSRLLRAFENLFRNSVEHGSTEERAASDDAVDHAGGVTVEVGTLADGFYVADDGPGVPTEEIDEVFDYGHTTSDDGTGLGLSIVDSVAEAHGWRCYLDATYEGGAMFVFADVSESGDADTETDAFEWGRADDA
ncbi:sensor histidine kinase [Haloarcula litorea]|uniref:sensor histidine kinase n=1 Tax=Haloarcula litorea TaxID=3032579 RepID=UPI0023E7E360|nr:histidine kinase dimerization/phospho-acceptor domain-containing protein [Halomicroarcula sp. GDY20]